MNVINTNQDNISTVRNELNKPKVSIVLIHHLRCGHCIHLRPVWERFKQINKNKPFNIIDIESNELSKLDHPIKNNIIGFPTIMKVKNGKVDENFNKERTLENINAFANNNIVKRKLNNLNNKLNNKLNQKKRKTSYQSQKLKKRKTNKNLNQKKRKTNKNLKKKKQMK